MTYRALARRLRPVHADPRRRPRRPKNCSPARTAPWPRWSSRPRWTASARSACSASTPARSTRDSTVHELAPATATSASARSMCLKGKEQQPVQEVVAGDIGAVAKLADTAAGDTLAAPGQPWPAARHRLPGPGLLGGRHAAQQGRPGQARHGPDTLCWPKTRPCRSARTRSPARRSCRAWARTTCRSWPSGCSARAASRWTSACPACPIARRSSARCRMCSTATRSRRAGTASSPRW